MGRLTVALNEQISWTIDTPPIRRAREAPVRSRPEQAFVFAREFLRAAAPMAGHHPELQRAVNEIATEEESTMVLLTWEREIDLVREMGETMQKLDRLFDR
jgi:hypothetical protein